jgi:TPR repeat protein
MLRAALIALAVILSAVPVSAGTWEDAVAAEERGDYQTALRLFRELAEQGHAEAQRKLGYMHDNGHGVRQNYAEAAKWYRMAAEQGDAKAQSFLGYMYYFGEVVPQDYVMAHMWFNLAGAQSSLGHVAQLARGERDRIAKRMTVKQIAEAQRLAREWMANHQ